VYILYFPFCVENETICTYVTIQFNSNFQLGIVRNEGGIRSDPSRVEWSLSSVWPISWWDGCGCIVDGILSAALMTSACHARFYWAPSSRDTATRSLESSTSAAGSGTSAGGRRSGDGRAVSGLSRPARPGPSLGHVIKPGPRPAGHRLQSHAADRTEPADYCASSGRASEADWLDVMPGRFRRCAQRRRRSPPASVAERKRTSWVRAHARVNTVTAQLLLNSHRRRRSRRRLAASSQPDVSYRVVASGDVEWT